MDGRDASTHRRVVRGCQGTRSATSDLDSSATARSRTWERSERCTFHELVLNTADGRLRIGARTTRTGGPTCCLSAARTGAASRRLSLWGEDVVGSDERGRVDLLFDAIGRIRNRDFLLLVDVCDIGPRPARSRVHGGERHIARWHESRRGDRTGHRRRGARVEDVQRRGMEASARRLGREAASARTCRLGVIGETMVGLRRLQDPVRGRVAHRGRRPPRSRRRRPALECPARQGQEALRVSGMPFVVGVVCAGAFITGQDVRGRALGAERARGGTAGRRASPA